MKVFRTLGIVLVACMALTGIAGAQKWQNLKHPPTFLTDTAVLLTDGTVMVHEICSSNWHRLTPNNKGSYVNGTWSSVASMPSSYAPLYFASQVLPDGKVLVEGGEYNDTNCDLAETSMGAIYDPLKNKWTNVNPPSGWGEIGDSPAIVLPNGTLVLGQNGSSATAFFNEKTLGWTLKGSGKSDAFAEEGMELLPNGKVLLVDTQTTPNSEIFNPKTSTWTSAGSTIMSLSINASEETGPALLRPDGTVFAMGADGDPGAAGHTAIFNTKTGKWAKGPDFPNQNDMADAPAAVLPNGHILCEVSPGVFLSPTAFYEFDGRHFKSAPLPHNTGTGQNNTSYVGRLLVLPTGQIMYNLADVTDSDTEIYTAQGTYQKSWAPTIKTAPGSVTRGSTYKVSGTQFNGLGHGAAYGDDAQMNSSYPLVRITNKSTKHVFYARTHDHSTMGIATGKKIVSTNFDVPKKAEAGASTLVVVANGIPSAPVNVMVK